MFVGGLDGLLGAPERYVLIGLHGGKLLIATWAPMQSHHLRSVVVGVFDDGFLMACRTVHGEP